MKRVPFIVLALMFIYMAQDGLAQSLDKIKAIRNELFYTDFDFDKCVKYYNFIVDQHDDSPLVQAYLAAAKSLMAKHTWNPINKISYLKDGLALLNKAVAADKENPEIRFLRLYIQRSIPSYMGLSGDIEEDKKIIIKHLDRLDVQELGEDLTAYIATYMAAPDLTTDLEASLIKEKLEVN